MPTSTDADGVRLVHDARLTTRTAKVIPCAVGYAVLFLNGTASASAADLPARWFVLFTDAAASATTWVYDGIRPR